MNERTRELETLPVKKLVIQYSLPTVIAMVVNSIYNMVDRIFVGHYVGEAALAGLTIAFPMMLMSMALAMLLGGGAAPLIAIRLGQKNSEGAARIFGTLVTVLFTVSLLVTVFGEIFLRPLLTLFGAEAETMVHVLPYMRIIFIGLGFQLLAINMTNIVRTEGHPRMAMATQIASALINLVLDFLFVVVFHWGIRGAAAATIIGQILGFLWLAGYYLLGKSSLELKPAYFIPRPGLMKEMVALGFSLFVTQFGASFSMLVLNRFLKGYGGTPALTAMGAINSLYTLFIMPLIGLQHGLQPIIGYNFGAGLRRREWDTLRFGIILGVGFASFVWLLLQLFPGFFLTLFIPGESATIPVAVQGLRIFVLMLPLLGFQMTGNSYFMAVNKPKEALLLSALRQFILLLPLLVILAPLMGLLGVWMATPLADGLASGATMLLVALTLRREKKEVSRREREELARPEAGTGA